MAIYQCFFYSCSLIGYWENLAASTDQALKTELVAELSDGKWESVEAWLGNELTCRIELSMLVLKHQRKSCWSYADTNHKRGRLSRSRADNSRIRESLYHTSARS